jgi:uncharacterized membrane protein
MMLLAPFLLIYALIGFALLVALLVMLEIELVGRVFVVLGLRPRTALLALLASLVGSYVNIPLYTVQSGPVPVLETVSNFGIVYTIPIALAGPATTVAINVGGALVPIAICIYALLRMPSALVPSALGTAAVTLVVHQFAYPLRGVGIALPLFIPPIVAALVAIVLARAMRLPRRTHVIAYVGGVLGTLIGADLSNLGRIAMLGAPVASIGGAGTFDGVFLTGIVAVLIAGI